MRFGTLNYQLSIIHYLNAELNKQMNLKWDSEIKYANKHTYDIYMQKGEAHVNGKKIGIHHQVIQFKSSPLN